MLNESKKNIHIISITGDLASGKSTVANLLAEELGYSIHRNGAYARQIAKELNMDITEYNKYVENHPEIDRRIEQSAAEYAKAHDNVIVDARLGWYAVPHSFKVYLKVDLDVSAKRALNDKNRKDTEMFSTFEDQKKDIQKRYELENKRFLDLYGIHREDLANYDLVIDTSDLTPEETKNKIIENYNKWLENKIVGE